MDICQVKFQNNPELRYFAMQSPDMKKKEMFDQNRPFKWTSLELNQESCELHYYVKVNSQGYTMLGELCVPGFLQLVCQCCLK